MQFIVPAGLSEDSWIHVFAQVSDGLGYVNGESLYIKVLASHGYRVSGKILDELGHPVIGATVQVGDETTLTDATGFWGIGGFTEGNYTVTASKG